MSLKTLFVMCRESTDHLATCVWDGLQEVLGEENVYDAVGHRYLHSKEMGESDWDGRSDRFGAVSVLSGISARRPGRYWRRGEGHFDLLVLSSSFCREFDWDWVRQWYELLAAGAKVAYLEGWDSAYEIHAPRQHVDAVFRKEIGAGAHYPYDCRHLTFAFPSRWSDPSDRTVERPWDFFYSGTVTSNGCRLPMLSALFGARLPHRSLVATEKMGLAVPDYFMCYRRAKLALCPASQEGADSLRTYEAISCGAVPLFVGYPSWRREEWFVGTQCFQCFSAGEVAAHVDAALGRDLPAMRNALLDHALAHHTTAARARKILAVLGVSP